MNSLKKMAEAGGKAVASQGGKTAGGQLFAVTERTMKYPYTLAAQIRQYPFWWEFNNVWIVRYWIYGTICSAPIFWWIQKKARTPENIAKWKEIHRKEKLESHIHD